MNQKKHFDACLAVSTLVQSQPFCVLCISAPASHVVQGHHAMPATNSLLFGWVSSLPRICIRFVLFQFQIARQMTGAANEAARATSVKLCDIILVYLTVIILQQCEQIVAHHSIKITCMHPGALLAARGGSPATPPTWTRQSPTHFAVEAVCTCSRRANIYRLTPHRPTALRDRLPVECIASMFHCSTSSVRIIAY